MAATFQIATLHGVSSSPTYVVWPAGGAFIIGDATPTAPTTGQAITRPAGAAFAYSWTKCIWLDFTSPPVGSIGNIRFWTGPEAVPAGTTLLISTSQEYQQPAAGDTAGPISAVDAAQYTQANPFVVYAGVILTAGQQGRGPQPFVRLQMRIASSNVAGTSAVRSFNYIWDEN